MATPVGVIKIERQATSCTWQPEAGETFSARVMQKFAPSDCVLRGDCFICVRRELTFSSGN